MSKIKQKIPLDIHTRHILIEVCCTGGNGRSPMAAGIANKILDESKLRKIRFVSSGTRADTDKASEILGKKVYRSYENVEYILGRAAENGFMEMPEISKEKYGSDRGYRNTITDYVENALGYLRPIESAFRQVAMHDTGIKSELGGNWSDTWSGFQSRQTGWYHIDNSVTILVLGVEDRHVEQAREIYESCYREDRDCMPLFHQINEYAGLSGHVAQAIGSLDIRDYFDIRDQFLDIMPKVIKRFIQDYEIL